MNRPVRVAFCPILFEANGGQLTSGGLPVLDGAAVRGRCDTAYDCGQCGLLHAKLPQSHDTQVGWECIPCLTQTKDVPRLLPGFYQSGRDPTTIEGHPDFDPDRPTLPGCTRCGAQSSFLQLVIRRA